MLKEALWDRACFSERPNPGENTGETSSMAVGDAVHVHYPHVHMQFSNQSLQKSTIGHFIDNAIFEGKVGKSGSQGKQLPG